jgi:hypothetical protein
MTQDEDQGRLAESILHFCRTLRHAGLQVGTGAVLDALAAVAAVGIRRQDDFRFALRAVLASNPADFVLFEQAFTVYFRKPQLLERLLSVLLPSLEGQQAAATPESARRRLIESLASKRQPGSDSSSPDADRAGTYSSREVLSRKDFEQMNLEELDDTRRMLRDESYPVSKLTTRRFRTSTSGARYDLRKSMQLMMRCHGYPVQLARRRHKKRLSTLVLLCDISGSMGIYSRMFLLYAHALTARHRFVHTFVFGTRLTGISRWLRDPDTDRAMSRISAQVPDWGGGTRIGDCLRRFNFDWSRRVLDSNASVILLCDGLERDSVAQLEFQMQRLRRSCRQLIWMNPMLRYTAFEPRAGGIRAMLPHVDRFVPAHNIASIAELGRLLAGAPSSRLASVARVAA